MIESDYDPALEFLKILSDIANEIANEILEEVKSIE
jgi:hypothetical protein